MKNSFVGSVKRCEWIPRNAINAWLYSSTLNFAIWKRIVCCSATYSSYASIWLKCIDNWHRFILLCCSNDEMDNSLCKNDMNSIFGWSKLKLSQNEVLKCWKISNAPNSPWQPKMIFCFEWQPKFTWIFQDCTAGKFVTKQFWTILSLIAQFMFFQWMSKWIYDIHTA